LLPGREYGVVVREEAERAAKEAERAAKERLAAKLRELGIDPDQLR
jgi:hypothetical protein